MTQHAPVAQHDDWVSITPTDKGKQFPKERESLVKSTISFVEKTFTNVGLEARKIRKAPRMKYHLSFLFLHPVGTLTLQLFEPGWSFLDARAYSFQFLRIAASKALLPPGSTCLDV